MFKLWLRIGAGRKKEGISICKEGKERVKHMCQMVIRLGEEGQRQTGGEQTSRM